MAYTDKNYKTKKALKDDFAAGKEITVYQPGIGNSKVPDGKAYLEGPHYPEPHKWYAQVTVQNGVITSVK